MDKVSIILPAYNVESYLARTLRSLLNQTYKNLEILVVDDCSKDGTRQVIRQFAQGDPRIVPILLDVNHGVSYARNAALDTMTGDWVCFCDGDDWYAEDYLEQMISCVWETGADYVICDYYVVPENGPAIRSNSIRGLTTGCDPKLVVACGSPYSWTRMIKRDLFEKFGVRYPENCNRSEELPVIPVLATCSRKIGIVDKPLYYYFQRSNGSSASNVAQVDYEKMFFTPFNLLRQAIGDEYEQELEYLIIYALFYGRILDMCKQGLSTAEIKAKIREYTAQYPNYGKNPYLPNAGIFKRSFIMFERWNWILGLRILAKVHSLLVH